MASPLRHDATEIARFLKLLAAPGQVIELRLLKVRRTVNGFSRTLSGYFDDCEKLAVEAAKQSTMAEGTYVTLNPVNPELIARAANRLRDAGKDTPLTTDADITARRWLPIDVDPVRSPGISSTDEEHELALERARQIRDALHAEGWPRPILGDSGNGAHLLFRIDIPSEDNGLVKRCLEALALRFDDDRVKVDQSVFNPARIWKLYGTISRKGDSLTKRPHRLARILEMDAVHRLSVQLLEDLAARVPEAPRGNAQPGSCSKFDLDRWINDHRLDVSGPSGWKDGRRWIFPTCPWNSNHDNRSAFILQFPNGAIAAGCLHNGCGGRGWHALRDLVEPGWQSKPRASRGVPTTPTVDDWEPPVPFHQFDLPKFPIQTLPDWLQDFVQALSVATQTPVDLAAMLALAVVAAACAKKVAVCMRPGWVEPVNIFVVVALAPGNRKTAVFRSMTEPMENHEQRQLQRLAPEIARAKASLKIKETKLKKLQDRAASATKAIDQERYTQDATSLAAELSEAETLAAPRYIADDCTSERLATLLRDQSGRIAVMSAEGDVFDLMAGRYSPTSVANFGVYLKGHAGDALRIDRVGRAPEFVKSPALTIGLAVQPDVIRGLTGKAGFRGRGLLGRFLYSLPASLLGHRETNPPPVREHLVAVYRANVDSLLDLRLKKDEDGEAVPYELTLETGACARLQEFEAWIEPQLSELGELGGITDWAGKLVGAVGRIAGILHMANLAGTREPWDHPISQETIENAIQIGKYLIPHAKAAFAEMGADEFVGQAKLILHWIEQNNPESFSRRDLHQALRGTFKRVEDLQRPLALLDSHGFVRRREEPSRGPGRPPSPVYDVNPNLVRQKFRRVFANPINDHSEDSEDCEKRTFSEGPSQVA